MSFKIWINASPEKVYPAVSDLTRHAKWGAHALKIERLDSGPVAVGSKYTSHHGKAKQPDQVVITGLDPGKQFGFKATMPNKVEVNHSMTLSPERGGTLLVHNIKLGKGPIMIIALLTVLLPVITTLAPGPEKKFLSNLKAELEQGK